MGELWWAAMPLDEDEVDEDLINLAVYNAFRKESLKRYERLFVTAKNISNFIKRKKKYQDLLDIIQADKALLFLDEPKSGPKSRPRPIDDLLESAWNLIEQVKIEIDDIDWFYPEARGGTGTRTGERAIKAFQFLTEEEKGDLKITGVIPFFITIVATPFEYCYRIPLVLTCNMQQQTSTLL